jgi:hypothetical protein
MPSVKTTPKMIGQIIPRPRTPSGFARKKAVRPYALAKICQAVEVWKIRRGIWE